VVSQKVGHLFPKRQKVRDLKEGPREERAKDRRRAPVTQREEIHVKKNTGQNATPEPTPTRKASETNRVYAAAQNSNTKNKEGCSKTQAAKNAAKGTPRREENNKR